MSSEAAMADWSLAAAVQPVCACSCFFSLLRQVAKANSVRLSQLRTVAARSSLGPPLSSLFARAARLRVS